MMAAEGHIVSPTLLGLAYRTVLDREAQEKRAFVPPGGMGAPQQGGGGAPPGMDPAAMGMDPAATGGAPPGGPSPAPAPPTPAGGGGGGGGDAQALADMLMQKMQMMGGGAGGGQGANSLKPKIDVNVAITQILKILARIADSLGIQIPASEMVATSADLGQTAAATQGQGQPGAIAPVAPIDPMQPAMGGAPAPAQKQGEFDPFASLLEPGAPYGGQAAAGGLSRLRLGDTVDKAAAVFAVLKRRVA